MIIFNRNSHERGGGVTLPPPNYRATDLQSLQKFQKNLRITQPVKAVARQRMRVRPTRIHFMLCEVFSISGNGGNAADLSACDKKSALRLPFARCFELLP